MELIIKQNHVTCPKNKKSKKVRTCFGCDELKAVTPREGGKLVCSFK